MVSKVVCVELTDTALSQPRLGIAMTVPRIHARTFPLSTSLSVGLRWSLVKTLYRSGEAGGWLWRD